MTHRNVAEDSPTVRRLIREHGLLLPASATARLLGFNSTDALPYAPTRYGPECDPDGTLYQAAIDHTMSRMKSRTGRAIAERIYNFVQLVD